MADLQCSFPNPIPNGILVELANKNEPDIVLVKFYILRFVDLCEGTVWSRSPGLD